MSEKKKFVVACGGTGGHAFPGIAVAAELKRRGHEVVVWDSGRSIESSVMKSWDGPVFTTGARPLRLSTMFMNLISLLRCRREMKRFSPDAVLAMGSYSSLPPVMAARSRGTPVILHEANTVPGRAVEYLSRFAKTVAVSFADTKEYLSDCNVEVTGLPVRAGLAGCQRFDDVPENAFCVFVTGGSQGAHRVNELASSALVMAQSELAKRGLADRLFVIHQTGAADRDMVANAYAEGGVACRVNAFEHEMGRAFATADIVIARSGASTCFELAFVGKPAFFIPLPSAMRDHQHLNALAFVKAGAADEASQDSLTPWTLASYVLHKVEHPEELAVKAKAMSALASPQAAAKVADMMERA